MKKVAFIGRHEPTPEQIALFWMDDRKLVAVGDVDGANESAVAALVAGCIENGITEFCTAHAEMALNIASHAGKNGLTIWVCRNGQRPSVDGGKPTFFCQSIKSFTVHSGGVSFGVL